MNSFKSSTLIILLLLGFLGFSSIYTIKEGHQGLLLRLGEIVTDKEGKPKIMQPGLHFKIPFVNQVRIFDVRLKMLDVESSRVITAEQKDVLVDYFVEWRIEDVPLFFTRNAGSDARAENLLRQRLNDGLRAEFGKRDIKELVSGERGDVMELLQTQAEESAHGLGIEVIDVRVKRIDLPDEVSVSVYERMRTDRERVARNLRAGGEARANEIRATAERNRVVILSTAEKQAQETRGAGDAQAARVYSDAYQQNPEFYAFYRSLNAYQQIFEQGHDVLVLRPDGDFFRYFNDRMGVGE